MSTYNFEVQTNTSQSILTRVEGVAQEFNIKDYIFKSAALEFDKRAGYRYYVSKSVEAANKSEAYTTFMDELMIVTDSIAYFYSQPVSVEYWNILIKKDSNDEAFFGGYSLRPATSLSDYSIISPDLDTIIDKSLASKDLQNTLWIYNNIAKIDGVDYDPSSHQFGLCQLVESLSEKGEVEKCKVCGRGGYTRTLRSDIEQILGDDLYKKLYGGSDILRNRLGHGNLVGGSFLNDADVEDTILKVNECITTKYDIRSKVNRSVIDRIRGTNVWHGASYGIAHNDMGLEQCLAIHIDNPANLERKPITKSW